MSPEDHLVLAAEFPPATAAQWRAAVDRVLAGGDAELSTDELDRRFERRLVTTTYDDIAVQPLYSRGDLPEGGFASGVPGSWPYVRGSTTLGGIRGGWDVRQVVDLDQVAAAGATQALDHLERGATSLLLRSGARGGVSGTVDVELLDAALDGVYLELITVALDADLGPGAAEALVGLWQRREVDPAAVRGVLGFDPVGSAAALGRPPDGAAMGDATSLAVTCARGWPGVRGWVVDGTRYHEAGASDAEELACATATGLDYLRRLVEAGLGVTEALGQLEFRLAATADQFSTLAKFRAARQLWGRVAEVLGAPDAGGQRQHAMTSRAMLTRYDPWVNLLRNTTACFAAGAGGADAITVESHDLLIEPDGPSELGRRMARNTQLLLLEETHLARVLDPGGGSWYVESLTDAMARRAWALLQEIEASGGMVAALGSGLIHDRIEATWTRRSDHLARRSDTIVGVSDFANLDDRPPVPSGNPPGPPRAGGPLPRRRYAAAFEARRDRTERHLAETGTRPAVLLVCLGPASASTARATYAKSFFEAAGFRTDVADVHEPFEPDVLRSAAAELGATLACLCSSDGLYAEQGAAALEACRAANLSRLYVALRPGALGEELRAGGADELIHVGCDVLDVLDRALAVAGVP